MGLWERVRNRWLLLRWFVEGCRRQHFVFARRFGSDPMAIHESFRALTMAEAAEGLRAMTRGLDPEDASLVEATVKGYIASQLPGSVLNYEAESFAGHRREIAAFLRHDLKKVARRYGVPAQTVLTGVFLYHHGLRNAPSKVKEYIKGTVFLDCGAYIGDSSLIMNGYGPRKIYAFEINERHGDGYRRAMRANGIGEEAYELLPFGVGEREAVANAVLSSDPLDWGSTVDPRGSGAVRLVALDDFCRDKPRVGFVKADIEGHGLAMVRGMRELLRRDRPVLSLSIYHTTEEFFGIKPAVEALDLGYRMKIVYTEATPFTEITLFAYPEELSDDCRLP